MKIVDFGLAEPDPRSAPAAAHVQGDLWSLGEIVREMVYGPEAGPAVAPPDASMPVQVEELVTKLQSTDPDSRYADAGSAAADLKAQPPASRRSMPPGLPSSAAGTAAFYGRSWD